MKNIEKIIKRESKKIINHIRLNAYYRIPMLTTNIYEKIAIKRLIDRDVVKLLNANNTIVPKNKLYFNV